jgi:hypothetical protein
VRLFVFTIVALCLMVTAYAFGLGGAVSGLIFLLVLFIGVMDRAVQPMVAKLRP